MKYALVIFSFFLVCLSANVEARTITSFKKSDAITGLAQFLYEVAPDLPESVKLSDRKIANLDYSKCQKVESALVLEIVERSVRHVLRYFPDEEVPFEEAIYDLDDYLDGATYYQCNLSKKSKHTNVQSFYFADNADKIHLRLDKITPVQE